MCSVLYFNKAVKKRLLLKGEQERRNGVTIVNE